MIDCEDMTRLDRCKTAMCMFVNGVVLAGGDLASDTSARRGAQGVMMIPECDLGKDFRQNGKMKERRQMATAAVSMPEWSRVGGEGPGFFDDCVVDLCQFGDQ